MTNFLKKKKGVIIMLYHQYTIKILMGPINWWITKYMIVVTRFVDALKVIKFEDILMVFVFKHQ